MEMGNIQELLAKLQELKNTIASQKNAVIQEKKTEIIETMKQISELQNKLQNTIQELKVLDITPEDLKNAGYPEEIIQQILPSNRRSGRTTVIYHGQPTTAKSVCDQLGLAVNGDSAVRVLMRYIRNHPEMANEIKFI